MARYALRRLAGAVAVFALLAVLFAWMFYALFEKTIFGGG
jgi:hypothetical protein